MEMTLTRVTYFQHTMQSQRWTKRFVRMLQLWQKNFFQRVDKLLTLQFVALVKILKTERRNNYIFTNELKRKDGVDDKNFTLMKWKTLFSWNAGQITHFGIVCLKNILMKLWNTAYEQHKNESEKDLTSFKSNNIQFYKF